MKLGAQKGLSIRGTYNRVQRVVYMHYSMMLSVAINFTSFKYKSYGLFSGNILVWKISIDGCTEPW